MNTPQFLIGQMFKRANYNIGRVMKEAGLSKRFNFFNMILTSFIAMDRFGSRL